MCREEPMRQWAPPLFLPLNYELDSFVEFLSMFSVIFSIIYRLIAILILQLDLVRTCTIVLQRIFKLK